MTTSKQPLNLKHFPKYNKYRYEGDVDEQDEISQRIAERVQQALDYDRVHRVNSQDWENADDWDNPSEWAHVHDWGHVEQEETEDEQLVFVREKYRANPDRHQFENLNSITVLAVDLDEDRNQEIVTKET